MDKIEKSVTVIVQEVFDMGKRSGRMIFYETSSEIEVVSKASQEVIKIVTSHIDDIMGI